MEEVVEEAVEEVGEAVKEEVKGVTLETVVKPVQKGSGEEAVSSLAVTAERLDLMRSPRDMLAQVNKRSLSNKSKRDISQIPINDGQDNFPVQSK